jgi:RNA polymerase sigma factor (sigma-70 family)
MINVKDFKTDFNLFTKDFSEKEMVILELRYFRNMTYKEIGKELNISDTRAQQLDNRIKRKIKTIIDQNQ